MFGSPRTVESIIAPLNKILDRLKTHQHEKAIEAGQLFAQYVDANLETDKASALIRRLETLLFDDVETYSVPDVQPAKETKNDTF